MIKNIYLISWLLIHTHSLAIVQREFIQNLYQQLVHWSNITAGSAISESVISLDCGLDRLLCSFTSRDQNNNWRLTKIPFSCLNYFFVLTIRSRIGEKFTIFTFCWTVNVLGGKFRSREIILFPNASSFSSFLFLNINLITP